MAGEPPAGGRRGYVGLLDVPRVRLGTFPTPLQPAPRLSDALGVEVWFKRDDRTGLGLGGNKVRGLEYLLADAELRGADCLVTGGGPQSNWALLAALGARVRGLDTVLVSFGDPVAPTGNLLLATQVGAQLRFTGDEDRASVDPAVDEVAAELRAAGRTPYPLGRGGATAVGALGYVAGSLELATQLHDRALRPAQLWLATGSCGTQAGLRAGAAWLRPGYEVIGVSVSRPVWEAAMRVDRIADEVSALLCTPCADTCPLIVDGRGPAKGVRSPAGDAAAALVARTEGVFLDPVFGAKAMAALVAAAPDLRGPVVFLVTGGAPTLFTV